MPRLPAERGVDTSAVQRVERPTRDILVTRSPEGDREFAGFGKVGAGGTGKELGFGNGEWCAGDAGQRVVAVVEHALLCTCSALQAKTHEYADCFLDPAALPIDKIKVLGEAAGGGGRGLPPLLLLVLSAGC